MLNNEKRLLQRIQEGETELFTQIADHYSRAIFTLVVRIVGSAEEAEELTQDIFMKAFENLEYFSYRSSFSTWLYRIAYNTALSFARRKRPTQVVINERTMATIGDEQIEQMEQSFDQETIDALKRSIEMLDAAEKGSHNTLLLRRTLHRRVCRNYGTEPLEHQSSPTPNKKKVVYTYNRKAI